jgi:hypothetical protein
MPGNAACGIGHNHVHSQYVLCAVQHEIDFMSDGSPKHIFNSINRMVVSTGRMNMILSIQQVLQIRASISSEKAFRQRRQDDAFFRLRQFAIGC